MSNKYNIRYLDRTEFNNWDSFVDDCEYGTIFHKSFYLEEIFSLSTPFKFKILVCLNNENKLIAGMAFGVTRKLFKFQFVSQPELTPFSGLLIKNRDSKYLAKIESQTFQIIDEITSFLNKNYDFLSMSFVPNFKDIRGFSWAGYDEKVKYTYLQNLQDLELDLDLFEPSLKRQIKKGQKQDYKIDYSLNENEKKNSYYLINSMTKRKKRKELYNYKFFSNLIDTLNIHNSVKLYNIYLQNTPVYTVVLLIDKGTAYYWQAGGDYNFYNTGLNQVLLYEILIKLKTDNIKYFDFIGANTPSISKYKSNFGLNLVPYYYLEKTNNKILKLLLIIKSFLKKS